MGVDLGSVRIGVAVSDADRKVASPIDTIERNNDVPGSHRAIRALLLEWEADVLVVGLPLSLDGSDGPAARSARREAAALEELLGTPVELHDERLTTVTADRILMEQNMDAKARRKVVDQVAASIMLQAWLDGQS
ncbi:MAG: Holliday junction resolvase RuvX [Acidimicrobiales bacterium]